MSVVYKVRDDTIYLDDAHEFEIKKLVTNGETSQKSMYVEK